MGEKMAENDVWQDFVTASAYLYKQTHGVIEIDKGESTITKSGAEAFAESAYLLLLRDGVLDKPDIETLKNPEKLTEGLIHAFTTALGDPEKAAYVNNHRALYAKALNDALLTPIKQRLFKETPDNLKLVSRPKIYGCAPGASEEMVADLKRKILLNPQLRSKGITEEDIVIYTNEAEYHKAMAKNNKALD